MSCSRCSSHNSVIRTTRKLRPSARTKQPRCNGGKVATQVARRQLTLGEVGNLSPSPTPGTEGGASRFSAISHFKEDLAQCSSPFMTPSESIAAALDNIAPAIVPSSRTSNALLISVSPTTDASSAPHIDSTTTSQYPSLITTFDVHSGVHWLPSPNGAQIPLQAVGHATHTFIFTAPATSSLPSIALVPPPEGNVNMPARAFVDNSTDWTYTLVDPCLLAPPAQTSSGRVLHPLEYDVMQASSHCYPPPFMLHAQQVPVDAHDTGDTLDGCSTIPSAFEDDEEELKLLHESTSVVEVYVQGGVLCERPATKLFIPPGVIYTCPSAPAPRDTYDTDDDDDWEIVTPNTPAGFDPLVGPSGDATSKLPTTMRFSPPRELDDLSDGSARDGHRNLKFMACAARGLMASWRV